MAGILRRSRGKRAALRAETSVRFGEDEGGARGQRDSLAVRWSPPIPSRARQISDRGEYVNANVDLSVFGLPLTERPWPSAMAVRLRTAATRRRAPVSRA